MEILTITKMKVIFFTYNPIIHTVLSPLGKLVNNTSMRQLVMMIQTVSRVSGGLWAVFFLFYGIICWVQLIFIERGIRLAIYIYMESILSFDVIR